MDEGVFSYDVHCGSSFASYMDFDYLSELLGDECWLETVQGSDFFQQCSSDSSNLSNSPFLWSPSDASLFESGFGQLPGGTSLNDLQRGAAKIQDNGQELVSSAGCAGPPGFRINDSEIGRRLLNGPAATADPRISVMERLVRAIGYIKDSAKDRDVLIQIWGPRVLNGKLVLTTEDQPYVVNSSSTSLVNYRHISLNFQFSAEKNSNMVEGMPGRVFLGKVPEWTPDVQFFRSDEYSRVAYAQTFNVRGTLALPVFDQGSQTCLGVIEVVTTTQTVRAELDSVCEALQAVDLSSTGGQSAEKLKTCVESYHAALPDILKVMKSACLTQNLPLAQTWMRCVHQGKEGCRHSIENYIHCVSTVDAACYVSDPNVQGFHDACSEHHLLEGQGVAGKAFMTNEPCFYDDITSLCKTDYPLSHHARMFGLCAAVAIRLRSVHASATDFVLEFFLPADCRDPEEQKKMLGLLSLIMQKTCKSLRLVTDDELAKDTITSADVGEPKMNSEESTRPEESAVDQSQHVASLIKNEETFEFMYGMPSPSVSSFEDYHTFGEHRFGNTSREGENNNKRTKAENTITLEVLQQHFAGSLKDAAKNLGVCPTTLKRICRTQGIKRWPSRKIKKVGHSLKKLQGVIDSVQGPSGTFQIGSFYSAFSDLASPSSKLGITHQFPASNLSTAVKSSSAQLEMNVASHPTSSISQASLCGQSSNSSESCSSGSHHQTSLWHPPKTEDAAIIMKNDDSTLKRMRSHAHLNQMGQEFPKLLPRSQSHAALVGTCNSETLLPVPKNLRKELDGTRVKVTYGDDKIRIRMQNHWRLKDLGREIAKRFNVDASSDFQLKYLDDDSEWVLLTCDADWEECVEVCLSSPSNTIKLSLQVPIHHLASSSACSKT